MFARTAEPLRWAVGTGLHICFLHPVGQSESPETAAVGGESARGKYIQNQKFQKISGWVQRKTGLYEPFLDQILLGKLQ